MYIATAHASACLVRSEREGVAALNCNARPALPLRRTHWKPCLQCSAGTCSQKFTPLLSRDSPVDQRIDISLAVQSFDRRVDSAIKRFDIGERLMGQMTCFEIVPDDLNVIEFGRVFGKPLDGQPMLARIERRPGDFADMDRPIILDQHDGSCHAPGLGAKEAIELLQMRNEIGAVPGPAVCTMSRRFT